MLQEVLKPFELGVCSFASPIPRASSAATDEAAAKAGSQTQTLRDRTPPAEKSRSVPRHHECHRLTGRTQGYRLSRPYVRRVVAPP